MKTTNTTKWTKEKLFKTLFIYTLITFIIGLVMKITLVGWQIDTISHFSKYVPKQNWIEAGAGLGTQIVLVIATLVAYPVSMIKMYKMVKRPDEVWGSKNQSRTFKEYLIFLISFIVFDLAAISIIVVEHAPMDNGWIIFSIISVFFPTGFAFGTLMFLRKTKLFVSK